MKRFISCPFCTEIFEDTTFKNRDKLVGTEVDRLWNQVNDLQKQVNHLRRRLEGKE